MTQLFALKDLDPSLDRRKGGRKRPSKPSGAAALKRAARKRKNIRKNRGH